LAGALQVGGAALESPRPNPGGIPPLPRIEAVESKGGHVSIEWDGFGGPYHLQFKTNLAAPTWQQAGGSLITRHLTVALPGPVVFYQLTAPPARYGGAATCASCHLDIHCDWSGTQHPQAWEDLRRFGFQTNSECLVCHSVGFGFPTGFSRKERTPHLAGVQCENCHGPAGDHSVAFDDPILRPRVRVSAELCGGCHNEFHYPTYDEWAGSGHAKVTPAVAQGFQAFNGPNQMKACGPCHSGPVRLALLDKKSMPPASSAASEAIPCAVCHDPHQATPNGAQLRNPIASTNFYSYSIAPSDSFSAQYQPKIGICAQCHNARGAAWQDTETAPHPSGQYNLLLGNLGVLTGPPEQSSHQSIPTQCVKCHTHLYPSVDPEAPESDIGTVDHSFVAKPENCTPCHSEDSALAHIAVTQADLRQRIGFVKDELDGWALAKAPLPLREKYGSLAWEYHVPGPLSNPAGNPTILGPTAAEQAQVPAAIKEARFNLYLVVQDGSLGVHNGKFARQLLQVATDKVASQMSGP
jgi:hypothetical protein